jgi:hypothetical protein
MPFASALRAVQKSVPWRAPTGISWSTGPVPTQTQAATNWCWLATAASVDMKYGGSASQCHLADQLLATTGCCRTPSSAVCNQTGDVERALKKAGRHRSTSSLAGSPPQLAAVQSALGSGEPPVGQVGFTARGHHVVLLAAYGVDPTGADVVQIGDPAPLWNPTDLIWSQAHRYRGGVSWTHICWTRR